MAEIKKGDFIELEYTGKIKDTNEVFDTTDKKTALDLGIAVKNMEYGPVIICVGENFTLKGLEENIIGKEPGEYEFEIPAEKAFGKKDAKLIRMIPYSTFKKQNINPEPGMQINVDGTTGIIKTAGSGRCLVDFNHPISGKDVIYKIKINKIITDDAEKIKGFLELALKLKDIKVKVENGKASITTKNEIPKQLNQTIAEKIKELIPTIKEISFSKTKEAEKVSESKKSEEEDKKEEPKKTEEQKPEK